MARITKAQAQAIAAARAAHFTAGNVIRSDYWGSYDLVVDYVERDDHTWSVTVQRVKLIGDAWVTVERARTHTTQPERRDSVVAQGIAA